MARTSITVCRGERCWGTAISRFSASKEGTRSGDTKRTQTHMHTPGIAGVQDLSPTGEGIGRGYDRTAVWGNNRPLLN